MGRRLFIRKAYAEMKLDYDAQLASTKNYEISGEDKFCNKPISDPRKAGEVWVDGSRNSFPLAALPALLAPMQISRPRERRSTSPTSSTQTRGIKLFADQAFFAVAGGDIAPFLLKKDAEALCLRRQWQSAWF